MDLSRGRTSADRSDAARRRLELIGAQLAADPPHENAPYEHAPYENAPYEPGAPDHRPEPGRHRAPTLARRQRWSGEVHDRLPGRWQSLLGRGLTAQHIVVVLAVVAGFVCLAAWWVISARPSEIAPLGAPSSAVSAAPAPASTSAASAVASAAGKPAATPSGEVVVDVSGKVRKPGIVTLPPGSRVADALDAAGGPRHGAELDTVNLARVLVDGEQIVVGIPPVGASGSPGTGGGSPGSTRGATAPVNLNTATLEQLDTLPGVGPVTANSILDWRTEHGRFSSVDELLEVDGIGEATLSDLRDLVTV